jgi:hypothetical protein
MSKKTGVCLGLPNIVVNGKITSKMDKELW